MWAAVLWDLDGTLVDTEPLWMSAERELAEQFGSTWTQEDGLSLVGLALIDSGRVMRERLGLPLTPAEIVKFLVERVAGGIGQSVPWRPGAVELFRAFAAEGVPQALVTMSYAPIASAVAAHLPFGAVVSGDLVTNGKPHPEAYLTAARMLGVEPNACLAIEDSPTGATSANLAGCSVLAIPHLVEVPAAERRHSLATLVGHSPASLVDMLWHRRWA